MHPIDTTNTKKSILPSPPSSPIKCNNSSKRKRALSLSFIQNTSVEPIKKCKFNYLEPYLATSSSPNQRDHQYNRSLLSWACIARSVEKVKELMSNVHLDINMKSGPSQTTALHEAAFIGFEQGIHLLLKHSEIDLNITDQLGQTALHYAVQRNQVSSLRVLLAAGARLDLSCIHGRLPIHTAAMYGFEKCIELLLSHRQCHSNNPSELDILWTKERLNNQSVVECAVVRGYDRQLQRLLDVDTTLEHKRRKELIELAVHWNRQDCLQSLIRRGCPLTDNCLLVAVQQRKIDLVRILSAAGANPCLDNGQNPSFLYTANHGFLEMIPFVFTLSTSKDCIQQALFLASSIGMHEKLRIAISHTLQTLLSKKSL
ncbi:hypothetical protein G6F43_010715 [Rhizopus delemar]|nr:hypothetical protein G6F43_010715 [Rhizopus delemar]